MKNNMDNLVCATLCMDDILAGFSRSNGLRTNNAEYKRRMRQMTKKFLAWGNICVPVEITVDKIEDYLCELSANGKSIKTLHNHFNALSRFCEWLAGRSYIAGSPTGLIHLPKLEKLPPIFLNQKEYELTLKIAAEVDIFTEVTLALNTGMRMSEMRRLRWDDVYLNDRRLIVRHSKNKEFRAIPLSDNAMEVLMKQFEQFRSLPHVFPGGLPGKRKIRWSQPKMRGEEWWAKTALVPIVGQIPKFHMLKEGQTGRGWHMFRHTFATRLAQNGVTLYRIAEWLGHRSLESTKKYAHLTNGYDKDIEKASCPPR